jgi:HK97 family phage major capsid protein
MSTILELTEKRNRLWNTAKDFLDSKRGEDGLVSAEDSAAYDKMEADIVAMGKELDRLHRQSALDAELAKPTSTPILGKPQAADAPKSGRASEEYRKDFLNVLRGKPAVHNVLSTDPDANGGFLVPQEFESQIIAGLEEANIIRTLAKVVTTEADRKIPVAAAHSIATWTAENAAYTESNPTFDQKVLDSFKLTDLVKVSVELLQDSAFDLESYIANEFARAFASAEEQAFCVGTGTGQPAGIFTANGGQVGVTGGANITTDNIVELIYSLKLPYRRNAVFIMNDNTISLLRKLKDGNAVYAWQPSLQAGEPDRLLGYPIYTSPYAPTVAAGAFSIAFGDMKNFWIADRMGRTVQRLNELYSTTGQIGFVCHERLDAKVILAEGIKLLQISGT